MRLLSCIVGGAVFLTLAAPLALFAVSEWELSRVYPLGRETVRAAGPEAVEEGRRLAKLYGCSSCHGPALRGLLFNSDPSLVRNFAPNLTLLARSYSDEAFAQAIKQGVRPTDGRALWGMPSPVFAALSDDELSMVLAFIRAQPEGGAPNQGEGVSLQSRIAVVRNAWWPSDTHKVAATRPAPNLVALARAYPPADVGPSHERGRHLVRTICTECHGSDLKGDATEGGPDLIVASGYDLEAFRKLMRTGVSMSGRDLGIMSETARDDFKVFTDAEIDAIHAYLVARAAKAS